MAATSKSKRCMSDIGKEYIELTCFQKMRKEEALEVFSLVTRRRGDKYDRKHDAPFSTGALINLFVKSLSYTFKLVQKSISKT